MNFLNRAAVVVALGLTAAACSDSGDSAAIPALRVDLIRSAVDALQHELGPDQTFFEVNATPTLVNLFVANADATQATAYVYLSGKLQQADPAMTATGPTFTASQIAFDEAVVLADVTAKLPEATMRVFSVVGQADTGPRYVISVESKLGGQLEVPIRPDGAIIAAGG